jgi:hypothetical protein
MKITDAEIIRSGEKDLIDAITADLDWAVIEELFQKEHNLGIEEDIEYKRGDIVVANNKIAYKLEFEVKVNLSILLDRNGDYISVSIAGEEKESSFDNNEEIINPESSHEEELIHADEAEEPEEESNASTDRVQEDLNYKAGEDDNYKNAFAELSSEKIQEETGAVPDGNDILNMGSQVSEMMEDITQGTNSGT